MRPLTSFLGLLVLFAVLPSACADQAEGERCDTDNNNNDCEPGLVCTPIERLAGGEKGPTGAALCCAVDSTLDACQGATPGIPDNDAGGSGGSPSIEAGAGGAPMSTPEAGAGGTPSGPEAGIPDASASGG